MGACESCEGCSQEPDPETNKTPGPRAASERGCTDFLCLAAFLAFWCGMIVIAGISVANGDIDAIRFGADYRGNRCGRGAFEDRPFTVYPRMDADLFEQREFIVNRQPWLIKLWGLCVESCVEPDEVDIDDDGTVETVTVENYNWGPAATAAVDKRARFTSFLPEESETKRYCYEPTCDDMDLPCDLKGEGDDRSWQLNSSLGSDVLDKCEIAKDVGGSTEFYPYQQSALREYLTGTIGSFVGFMDSMIESRMQIGVCSLVVTFALCYVWMFSMRFFAKFVVYTMLFLMFAVITVVVGTTFAYSCFIVNDEVYNCTAAQQQSFSYSGVTVENTDVFRGSFFVALVIWILFVISICRLGNAIETCIAIVEESSHVVAEMPFLMVVPSIATGMAVGVFFYFTYIGVYIATSNEGTYAEFQDQFSQTSGYETIVANDSQQTIYFLFAYHLFGTLWALSFLVGIVMMTVAGGVGQWYFFRDSEEHRSRFPTVTAFWVTLRFHLGTVAFGSLLIAICQFLRIVLEYIDQRTKDLQESNFIAKLVLKCVKCCMWCLEKCLKFITGYAYIYTAIEGMGFCNAARSTFMLIMKYPAQVYINHLVQFVLKLVQSITIPFIAGIWCYYWVLAAGNPNPMYAAILTVFISFFVTRIFASVYEVVIEAIFVCSFRDRDKYDACHTPEGIKKAFGLDTAPADKPNEAEALVKKA